MYEQSSNDFATGYAVGRDSNMCGGGYGYGNGMFANDAWWIIILLIFGWGGNRGFGGGFGGSGVGENYVLATDFATIERKLDGVNNGLCDGFYAQNTNMLNGFASVQQTLCQGFNGLQQTAMQGFHGVDNAICTLGYQNQAGFNALAHQISDCCCTTQRAIDSVKYENAKNTCDIIRAGQDNTRAILDFLTQDKIATLTAENQSLKFQASQAAQNAFITANQEAQTAELIRRLDPRPCPQPAYVVQPPQPVTFATNCCGGTNVAGYGYNNGGCGCGCN